MYFFLLFCFAICKHLNLFVYVCNIKNDYFETQEQEKVEKKRRFIVSNIQIKKKIKNLYINIGIRVQGSQNSICLCTQ